MARTKISSPGPNNTVAGNSKLFAVHRMPKDFKFSLGVGSWNGPSAGWDVTVVWLVTTNIRPFRVSRWSTLPVSIACSDFYRPKLEFQNALLGNCISISAHQRGHMIDASSSLEEGAFSLDSCGGL